MRIFRNRMAGAALCATIVATTLPQVLAAQQSSDTVKLREVVVTATRLETAIGDAPGGVTVLRGDAMRQRGQTFLADALRTVPGVSLARSAGPGALTAVFMRGGESDYVQVLIDGVQVNDPGGSFDWAHLRTEDVERVEIVRGPSSVLYGSDAVSGVIQIFTRSGGAARVEAGVNASRGDKRDGASGSFDTRVLDASVTGSTTVPVTAEAMLSYGFSAAHTASTGLFAFNSDYDNSSATGRVRLDAGAADIAVSGRLADNEYHYPTSGGGFVTDRNQFSTGGSTSFGVDAGYRLLAPVELRLLATYHDTDLTTDNAPDDDGIDSYWSTTNQVRRALDARLNIDIPLASVLTIGAEREWQEARTAFESVSEFGTSADNTDDSRRNTGLYAQLHGAPVEALSLTVGARIDDNAEFGTFRTGRAAASWRPLPPLRIHVSIGTAFKEPTFYENFATAYSRGNPDLEPEQARSRDAGAEIAALAGAVVIGATYFEQRFRNLIQYTFNTPTPESPNYFNVGAARARGVELHASLAVRALTASFSYTHTATRVTDDGFGEDLSFQEGRRMLRRPAHQAAVTSSLRLSTSLTALLDARYAGSRDDLDFTDPSQWSGIRTTLDEYTVVDAGLLLDAGRFELSGGVRNLLDTDYQEIYNFPTAGRVFYLGVRAGLEL